MCQNLECIPMNFFNFFKKEAPQNANRPSGELPIDLENLTFVSNHHLRKENGQLVGTTDHATYRGVKVTNATSGEEGLYTVSIHMLEGKHPIWQDNLTMAPKTMSIIGVTEKSVTLRGISGMDVFNDFSDYGIGIEVQNGKVSEITLRMYDRNIDITYRATESVPTQERADSTVVDSTMLRQHILSASNEAEADQLIQVVSESEHPSLWNQLGECYLQFDCTAKAKTCFTEGAKAGLQGGLKLEDHSIVLGIARCLTNLVVNFPMDQLNANFNVTQLSYLLLSHCILTEPTSESFFTRASLLTGHESPLVIQGFLHKHGGIGVRQEPYFISDYFMAAHASDPTHSELLAHAGNIKTWLGDTNFAGKGADEYSLKEFAELGGLRHMKLYHSIVQSMQEQDFEISLDDITSAVIQ